MMRPTIADLEQVLESAKNWPTEDREALAEAAHEIHAQRSGVYVMADDERIAVNEGLSQARQGDVVAAFAVKEFWHRLTA